MCCFADIPRVTSPYNRDHATDHVTYKKSRDVEIKSRDLKASHVTLYPVVLLHRSWREQRETPDENCIRWFESLGRFAACYGNRKLSLVRLKTLYFTCSLTHREFFHRIEVSEYSVVLKY